jgi:hypothetical protein
MARGSGSNSGLVSPLSDRYKFCRDGPASRATSATSRALAAVPIARALNAASPPLNASVRYSGINLKLITNDIVDSNAECEVVAIFHTNAGHVTLHDGAYNVDRNIATGNPYKDLVAVCGGAKAHHWSNADPLPGVKVNTDATARTTQIVPQRFVKITE